MSSPSVALEDVSLALGAFALKRLSFAVEAGEIGVILGPNGAGKSVTLETIAGFHRPAQGRIMIAGRDVTALAPERRRVGFIFQNFGLFPHLSVAENVAFGLSARGERQHAQDTRALLARFGLEALAARSPADLSPGEKQRAALARSLATRPDVFLLDEPFSALDARTGEALRAELKEFIRTSGIPAIFVTHDHLDAMTLADKVGIMRGGEIVQAGALGEVFEKPASRFVAEFLRVENILAARVLGEADGGSVLEVAGKKLRAHGGGAGAAGRPAVLCIRAEAVRLSREGDAAAAGAVGEHNRLPGKIVSMTSVGPLARIVEDCGFPLVAYVLSRTARELAFLPGAPVVAEIDPAAIHVVLEGQDAP
ncbi:MAG: ABC transporter ATP-binding protein [Alphaproteobacteria bacterium]